MYLGGADLAWVSDYAQIYFADADNPVIAGIEDWGSDIFDRGWKVTPNALVVYTADCLRQVVQVSLHDQAPDATPSEALSGDPWSRTVEANLAFPSGRFVVSSPARTGVEPYLPQFRTVAPKMRVRVSWLQYDEHRYNAFRPRPDVIAVALWPAE